MTQDPAIALKNALLDTYGAFADRRIKNIGVGNRFIVDGRTRGDMGADGHPLGWFCRMLLEVRSGDEVVLRINNLPTSPTVDDWLKQHGTSFGRDGFEITIARGEEGKLAKLAAMVREITLPGRRYPVRHYKYAVPRVVDALGKLERGLNQGWLR